MQSNEKIISKQQTACLICFKRAIISVAFFMIFLLSSSNSHGQAPTTWWYNNGVPDSVYIQTDVFSFRCYGALSYTGTYDTTIIDSIIHRSSRPDAANDVFFNSNSTMPQRLLAVQEIHNSGQLEIFYLNISTDSSVTYSSNRWYTIDNTVLINFNTTYPDSLTVDSFMTKYGLSFIYKPLDSLPLSAGCSYTYAFRVNIPSNQTNNYEYIAELLQDMYEDSAQIVCMASPNIVNIRNATSTIDFPQEIQSPIYEMCGINDPNDYYIDRQWYIHNDAYNEYDFGGFGCFPPPPDGVQGADAKICECWNEGLTGTGTVVCIIASGEINFDPPYSDLQNQSYDPLLMWDCTVTPCTTLVSNYSWASVGMSMADFIASTKNNNFGSAGIAEEAILSHIKIGNNFISDFDMIKALQKALDINVHIIATEYVSPFFSGAMNIELRKHHDEGRHIHPSARGTIIISPAGHTKTDPTGTDISHFPACYNLDATPDEPEVIGVIGSNVYDKLETGWFDVCNQTYTPGINNYSYPSNFGKQYDIAAPAAGFWHSQDSAPVTSQDANEVAIVGGVVALLLGDNPYLSDIQIRDKLRGGADKVGPYNYTGPLQHSTQLAAGRINCHNSFLGWPSIANQIAESNEIVSVYTMHDSWQLKFSTIIIDDLQGELFEINGKAVLKFKVEKGRSNFSLNHSKIASGLYVMHLSNGAQNFIIKTPK